MSALPAGAGASRSSVAATPAEEARAAQPSWCDALRTELLAARQLLKDGVAQLQQGFDGMAEQIAARDRLLHDLLMLLAPGGRGAEGGKGIQGYAAEATGLVTAVAQRSSQTAQWTLQRLQGISAILAEMSGIMAGIEQLSTQIRFLSLNAAIEAARAGDRYPAFAAIAAQVERVASESARLNGAVTAAIVRMHEDVEDVMGTAVGVARDLEEHAAVLRGHADEMSSFIAARTAAAAALRQPVSMSVTALQLDDVIGQTLQRLEARIAELAPHLEHALASAAGAAAAPRQGSHSPAASRGRLTAPAAGGNGAAAHGLERAPRQFRPGTVELF